jgi:sarcosine oxidase subunit gamma
LWLGPDEWLITAPENRDLLARVRRAVTGRRASVTDVSAAHTVVEFTGPNACMLLQKGCSLDLHRRAFGPGRCAQTLVARAQIILDQLDAGPTYRLFVRPSFARYLCDWLIDAAS